MKMKMKMHRRRGRAEECVENTLSVVKYVEPSRTILSGLDEIKWSLGQIVHYTVPDNCSALLGPR